MRRLLESLEATYEVQSQGAGFSVKARVAGGLIGTLYVEVPKHLTPECRADLKALSRQVGRKLDPMFVGWVNVHSADQRVGIGTRMYQVAVKELARRGQALVQATCAGKTMTPAAGKIWTKLKRQHPSQGDVIAP